MLVRDTEYCLSSDVAVPSPTLAGCNIVTMSGMNVWPGIKVRPRLQDGEYYTLAKTTPVVYLSPNTLCPYDSARARLYGYVAPLGSQWRNEKRTCRDLVGSAVDQEKFLIVIGKA